MLVRETISKQVPRTSIMYFQIFVPLKACNNVTAIEGWKSKGRRQSSRNLPNMLLLPTGGHIDISLVSRSTSE